MNEKATWEEVTRTKSRGEITDRLKVSSGWIYRTTMAGATEGVAVSTVFVADMDDVLRRSTQASADMIRLMSADAEGTEQ